MAEPTAAEPRTRSRRRLAQTLRPLASRPYRLMWLGAHGSSVARRLDHDMRALSSGRALIPIAIVRVTE